MNNLQNKMIKEDYIILERLISEYGESMVINEMRLPKRIISKVAGASLLAGSLIGLNHQHNQLKQAQSTEYKDKIEHIQRLNPYGFSDGEYALFKDRVNAVNTEIKRIFDIQGIDFNTLGFSPEYLVMMCQKNNYDIPLTLAQLRQESAFGTTPRAKKHNSMFSIGAWDNGQNRTKFATQDDAIKHYIFFMLEDYLDGGKISVDNLLQDGNFVNYMGKRYAKDKNYEKRLRSIRNSLLRTYPCLSNAIDPSTYVSENES